ncbi:hypothetical protein JTE90_024757 [Oedothorax gibbosus]|uniref:THAP-type domain-containing protein n=1 Tax=Oedothorax gibbosus TaxID=931172 RepID=A0AAV6UA57_9ARAC|nr:hypothetical protein JTE90_024757 [Oedothorax gibbosus]
MVNTCVVPGCRRNYDKQENVTLFRFPKDKFQLQKWVSTIPRENFTPSKHSRVCLRHFKEEDIRRHTEAFDEKGQKLSVALQQPRLKDGAVPFIFPGCPKYLSNEKVRRPCPDAKKRNYGKQPIGVSYTRKPKREGTIDNLAILRTPQIRRKVVDGAVLAEKLRKGDVHYYNTDHKQSERKTLVRTLGAYLMKACAIMDKPSKEEKILMARSITETFPALRSQDTPNGCELYYDPVSHTGFLEHFIRGRRSSDPNIAIREYGKRKHEVEASTSIKDANDYMARNKLDDKEEMETIIDSLVTGSKTSKDVPVIQKVRSKKSRTFLHQQDGSAVEMQQSKRVTTPGSYRNAGNFGL